LLLKGVEDMYISNIITNMPCLYKIILVMVSVYWAIHGVTYTKVYGDKSLSLTQRIIIEYIQEVVFKIVITVSGFIALLIVNDIFISLKSINDIGTGTAVLLIFLILWGILGISGWLPHLIVTGKFTLR
jgi:hypothetical protein